MATLLEVSLSIAWAEHFAQGPLRKVELVPLTEIPDGGDLSAVYGGNRREESGRCRREADIECRDYEHRNWAESALTGVVSERTGVRAKDLRQKLEDDTLLAPDISSRSCRSGIGSRDCD
jgi:hypothetical protein